MRKMNGAGGRQVLLLWKSCLKLGEDKMTKRDEYRWNPLGVVADGDIPSGDI